MGNGVSNLKSRKGRHRARRQTNERDQYSSYESSSTDWSDVEVNRKVKERRKESRQRRTTRRESPKLEIRNGSSGSSSSIETEFEDYSSNMKQKRNKRKHAQKGNRQEMLTKEELFELTSRDLRKRCCKLGIDTSAAIDKSELVDMLYNNYRISKGSLNRVNNDDLTKIMKNDIGFGSPYNRRRASIMINDETEQMIEILQEIIPFFGQGDSSLDATVRETIERLPRYAIDTKDPMGNTILMLACQFRAIELVSLLIRKGSDVNAQNNDGATCLHFSCYSDSFSSDIVKLLIENGAKADVAEERFGCTPLHWVASLGVVDICKVLFNAGALPNIKDKNGCDSIFYAKQSKNVECFEYLQSINNHCSGNKIDIFQWERNIDEQSGYIYYHNPTTGHSMWEDEFIQLKNQISISKENEYEFQSKNNNKRPPPPSPGIRAPLNSGSKTHNIKLQANEVENESNNPEAFTLKQNSPVKIDRINLDQEEVQNCKSSQKQEDNPTEKRLVRAFPDKNCQGENLVNQDIESINGMSYIKKCDKIDQISKNTNSTTITPTNNTLAIEIPTRKINFSQSEQPRCSNTDLQLTSPLTKSNFEERLAALQSKMEEQFVNQLKKIEEKIKEPEENSHKKTSKNTGDSVVELSSKVIQLQSDIGTKDLQILSLKRDIAALETKLAVGTPKVKSKTKMIDAMIGDRDLCAEAWLSPDEAKNISDEIKQKGDNLVQLQRQCDDLKSKLGSLEIDLARTKQDKDRVEDRSSGLEKSLQEEKKAKEDIIALLEKTKKGIQVDSEVTKSIEEQRERDAKLVLSLQKELKQLEQNKNSELKELSEIIAKEKTMLRDKREKFLQLTQKVESMKTEHSEELKKIAGAHAIETESIHNQLNKSHQTEKEELERQLQEERLMKIEKEVERNDAIQSAEAAKKEKDEAKSKLASMVSLVKEAKLMVGANERLHRLLQVETDKRKTLHNKLEDLKGRIRVYVRIRPISTDERSRSFKEALKKEDKRTCVLVREDARGVDTKSWEFDQIFCGTNDQGNSQEEVFKDTRMLVTSAVDGFNVCIFAYGQTGSGKTFTMFGSGTPPKSKHGEIYLDDNSGLAPRVAVELFRILREKEASSHIGVTVNMFELYNDGLRDLLGSRENANGNNLKIKLAEHSDSGLVEVDGAVSETVSDENELLSLFKRGSEVRTTATTQMNADSSRSHLVTSMVTKVVNKRTGREVSGKLTLVDLAGSERVSKSGATGNQLKEAQSINKSLSALGDVIGALTNGSKHIPYRNHPLTMLMSDSIGGNAKTLMFVCASPADYNTAESTNSLDFAKRCKDVTNNIKGSSNQSTQIKALRSELVRMKREKGSSRRAMVSRRPGL